MADAIGLKGIHNVGGVCDLCGVNCDPNIEELNALDCTYKDCPPMVYHQDCLEKYLKSIRLEKNRKTGFKCPRGCGKGTRYNTECRGKVDKSHPIHVRHDAKQEKKETIAPTPKTQESKSKSQGRPKAIPNVHEMQLTKLDRVKSEEVDRDWGTSLRRSKSMDKSTPKKKSKGRKSSGSITFNATPKMRQKCAKPEISGVPHDQASRASTDGNKSQGDLDLHSDAASLTRAVSINSQSPDIPPSVLLPKLEETPSLLDRCKSSIAHWKSSVLVRELHKMGFDNWKAEAAVHIFGEDLENALQWLMDNPDLRPSQISSLLQHHPPTEISIDYEMETVQNVCRHYRANEDLLQKTVIQSDGDVASAIDCWIGRRNFYGFPGCDLSLGIVRTESPLDSRRMDDLEGVLGSVLDAYKSGYADFTELANMDRSPMTNSPLSQSWSSPTSELRHFIGDLLE